MVCVYLQELRERRDVEALQASGKRAPQDSKAAARHPPRRYRDFQFFGRWKSNARESSCLLDWLILTPVASLTPAVPYASLCV